MRVLFDQGTPVPLRKFLQNHQVETAFTSWPRIQKIGSTISQFVDTVLPGSFQKITVP